MRLKNVLIVVEDIERSKAFYQELFDLHVIADFGENVILTEGLVLQERKVWEDAIGCEVVKGGNAQELYFEEYEFDKFMDKLSASKFEMEYIPCSNKEENKRISEKRVVRFFDPDRHIIEVAEHV